MIKEAKQLKAQLTSEMEAYKPGTPIDQITIMMYSKLKDGVDKEQIKTLSEYMNGRFAGTHTNKVIR